jgi:hypothetical protein
VRGNGGARSKRARRDEYDTTLFFFYRTHDDALARQNEVLRLTREEMMRSDSPFLRALAGARSDGPDAHIHLALPPGFPVDIFRRHFTDPAGFADDDSLRPTELFRAASVASAYGGKSFYDALVTALSRKHQKRADAFAQRRYLSSFHERDRLQANLRKATARALYKDSVDKGMSKEQRLALWKKLGDEKPHCRGIADDILSRLKWRMTLSVDARVMAVQFSSDAQRVLAACDDYTLRTWDASTGKPETIELKDHPDWWSIPLSMSFSHDAKHVICCYDPQEEVGCAYVWDTKTGERVSSVRLAGLRSAALSSSGRAVLCGDQGVSVWNTEAGGSQSIPMRMDGSGDSPWQSVAVSSDGARVAAGMEEYGGATSVWDAGAGTRLFRLTGHKGWFRPVLVGFSGDGTRVVSSGSESVRVWTQDGKELRMFKSEYPTAVGLSNDGGRVISGGRRHISVWSVETGDVVCRLEKSNIVNCVALSPDGQRAVSAAGYRGRTVCIWHGLPM